MPQATDIRLIRHAPTDAGGRLAGRLDVPARLPDAGELALVRALAGTPARLVVSPRIRCTATATALFPALAAEEDARLAEQDFGAWEGTDPATLPDLGPLAPAALAAHRPPGGESFADLCARALPALAVLSSGPGPVVVIAHAGTIRAALALALAGGDAGAALRDCGAALAFQIAPLSVTHLRAHPGGWSIAGVNLRAGPAQGSAP